MNTCLDSNFKPPSLLNVTVIIRQVGRVGIQIPSRRRERGRGGTAAPMGNGEGTPTFRSHNIHKNVNTTNGNRYRQFIFKIHCVKFEDEKCNGGE